MRLLGTELQRFAARRATRWMLLLAIVVIVIGLAIAANHSKVTTQTTGSSCQTVNGVTQCETTHGEVDNRVKIHDDLADAIRASGLALLLLGVLLGATFIGGDYVGGALGSQLVFEPRRTRMFTAKAVAVAVGVGVLVIVILVVLSAGLIGVAEWRGVVAGLNATWWTHRAEDIGRVAAACMVVAAVGFAITTLARRTVAAVVGFLAFSAIVEPALTHAVSAFKGRTPVIAFLAVVINDFNDAPPGVKSLTRSAIVAGIWAAVVLVLTGVVFARREIR